MSPGNIHFTDNCRSVTEVLQRVGDKWTVMVVMMLRDRGVMRFSEIRRAIPAISQRMLTLTLRALERDGLVSRTVTPSIPPRVDYELTEMGHSLARPVLDLGLWAIDHIAEIQASRAEFDGRGDSAAGAEG